MEAPVSDEEALFDRTAAEESPLADLPSDVLQRCFAQLDHVTVLCATAHPIPRLLNSAQCCLSG